MDLYSQSCPSTPKHQRCLSSAISSSMFLLFMKFVTWFLHGCCGLLLVFSIRCLVHSKILLSIIYILVNFYLTMLKRNCYAVFAEAFRCHVYHFIYLSLKYAKTQLLSWFQQKLLNIMCSTKDWKWCLLYWKPRAYFGHKRDKNKEWRTSSFYRSKWLNPEYRVCKSCTQSERR